MKKLLSVVLCVAMLVTSLCVFTLPASASTTTVYKFTFEDPDAETILKKVGLAVGEIVEWPEGSGNHCLRYELNAENRTGGGGAHPYIWPVGIGNALVAQGDLEDTGSEIELKIDMACDGSTQGSYMYPFLFFNDEEENYADHSVYAPGSGKFNTGIFNWSQYEAGAPVSGLSNGGICFCDEGTLPEGSYMYIDNIEFNWVGEWNDADDLFIGYPNGTPCEESDLEMSDLEIDPSDYDEDVVLQVANVTVEEGASRVEVPVNVVKNNGICAFITEITFDPSVLRFYDADAGWDFGVTSNDNTPGVVRLVFTANGMENYTKKTGTIFTLIFDVVGTGKSKLSMTFPDAASNITADMDERDMAAISGSVKVSSEPAPTDPTVKPIDPSEYDEDVVLQIADVTVDEGVSQVEVPVIVAKNNGIWAFIAKMTYDPSVLSFSYAEGRNFNVTPNESTRGVVKMVLDAKEMEDYTKQSGTMFTLVFDVVGTGQSDISMTFPSEDSNYNVDFDYRDIVAVSGSVTVSSEPTESGEVDLQIADVTVEANATTVSVPVNILYNDGVWGFIAELVYDPQVLRYTGADARYFYTETKEESYGWAKIMFDAKEMENYTDSNCELCKLNFEVVGPGTSEISMTCPDPASNINVDFCEVSISIGSGSVTVEGEPEHVSGDVNGDGAINMKDVLATRKFIVGINVTIDTTAANCYDDGVVNAKDELWLRRLLADMELNPYSDDSGNSFAVAFDNVEIDTNASTVEVPLNITQNDGVWAFLMDMSYDAELLKFDKVESEKFSITPYESTPGSVCMLFDAKEMTDVTDVDTQVAVFTFSVVGNEYDGFEAMIHASCPDPASNINVTYNEVEMSIASGSVTMTEPHTDVVNDPESRAVYNLTLDNMVVSTNSSVIQMPLYGFMRAKTFMVDITYDASHLIYAGIEGCKNYTVAVVESFPGTYRLQFTVKEDERVAFAREHGGSDDYWWEDVVGFLTFTPQQVFPELLTSVTAVSSRNNTNNQNYDGSSCVVIYDGGDIKFAAPKPNSDGEIALAFDDVVMEEYASTVKVPLYITNNCGNWAFIIEMNYDPSVLRFSGISSLFYNITVNEFELGRVKMVFDAKKMENVPYVTGNAAWITFDVVGPYDSLSLLTATIPDPASNIDVTFRDCRLTVSDGYVKLPPDPNAPSKNSGDANGDSVVNMKDVLLIRKFIANLITDIDMESADANGDSVVNMKDVLMIRKYIAGLIETLGV